MLDERMKPFVKRTNVLPADDREVVRFALAAAIIALSERRDGAALAVIDIARDHLLQDFEQIAEREI